MKNPEETSIEVTICVEERSGHLRPGQAVDWLLPACDHQKP